MYRCYLINFGYYLQGEFETAEEAFTYGKSKGFEFSVIERSHELFVAGKVVAAWSPISGERRYV